MATHSSVYPTVSAIIPTYNEAAIIDRCLTSLRSQDYPQDKVEILIVDDKSTDITVAIARQHGAKIIESGYRHIERSKSLGLAQATGELILLIDADITLVDNCWLAAAVQALQDNPTAIGAQSVYWRYDRRHTMVNRYCELLGVNDPFVYMLGRRGILGPDETKWPNPAVIQQTTRQYWLAEFSPANLPTLGSQGYLTRRELVMKQTDWQPYFFHLDSVQQLVSQGHGQVVLLRKQVEHDYAETVGQFYRKLWRNLILFWQYREHRRYTYGLGSFRFIGTVLLMVTVIVPLLQALRGFLKRPDPAWFLHPLFCFTVPILYTAITLGWKAGLWRVASK